MDPAGGASAPCKSGAVKATATLAPEIDMASTVTWEYEGVCDGRDEAAWRMSPEDFKTNTVFYCYPESMNSPTIPRLVIDAHLAQGIPALTPAAGAGAFGDESLQPNMINLDNPAVILRPNGWPSNPDYPDRWCHSDMKDVAYFYNFKFYDKAIEKGNLK
jgi:hypothetical protein